MELGKVKGAIILSNSDLARNVKSVFPKDLVGVMDDLILNKKIQDLDLMVEGDGILLVYQLLGQIFRKKLLT